MRKKLSPAEARKYWRTNLRYLAWLLAIWAFISLGCGILFVDQLNEFRIGDFKLGFWIAQQGSIYTFIILILVYNRLMNALDRKFNVAAGDSSMKGRNGR